MPVTYHKLARGERFGEENTWLDDPPECLLPLLISVFFSLRLDANKFSRCMRAPVFAQLNWSDTKHVSRLGRCSSRTFGGVFRGSYKAQYDHPALLIGELTIYQFIVLSVTNDHTHG
jgi:hypothetical protein